ncbi:MAG TPA: 23S rRNA (uracil(1939)-C(5))-methyltransferase RlmD [Thiolinea sp.]|nr:23S rRNA (uracil(1939)-C(5))-methyltransferase RlmD [Thiolinea sp.]
MEGRGVAHVDGKTVFIEGGIPGERVRFSYQARKPNFDEAQVLEVLEASPERVEPECPHYALCGACSWQHIALEAQIHYKQRVLLDNLAHIGRVEPETVFAPLTADGWGYRRKARLGVRWVAKKARALVGFRERSGQFLADLARCEVLHPSVGEKLETLQALISSLEARQTIPQIEVAVGDNATALVVRHMEPLSEADTRKLLAFAETDGFQLYLQPQGPDSVHRLWPPVAELYYEHPAFGVRVGFDPLDFFQVNQSLNLKMVQRALELLEVGPQDRVLDLFCGLGNFTLPLARRAAGVTGVEGDAAMVTRARAVALANGIHNTGYFACNLMDETELAHQPWFRQSFDKILLDPPRAGAREVISRLARTGARRIVYVSCHPGTLARDAEMLVHTQGYRLLGAGVIDMFPHTSHVESIAVFGH